MQWKILQKTIITKVYSKNKDSYFLA